MIDPILEFQIKQVEKQDLSIPLTLMIGGAILSGTAIPGMRFVTKFGKAAGVDVKIGAPAPGMEPDTSYLHLEDVTVTQGGNKVNVQAGALRLKMEDVSGWFARTE